MVAFGIAFTALLAGCSNGANDPSEAEIKEALSRAGYAIEFGPTAHPEGGGNVITGTATAKDGTTLEFAATGDGASLRDADRWPSREGSGIGGDDMAITARVDAPPAESSSRRERMMIVLSDEICKEQRGKPCQWFP
jgi:hypothetical protein